MSVVTVTSRSAIVRAGPHYGVEFVPARLVGIVPGVRPVRLATMVAVLCAAVVAAFGLAPSVAGRSGGGGVVAPVPGPGLQPVAGPGIQIVPMGAVGPISAVLGSDLPSYRIADLATTNVAKDLRAVFSSRGVTVVSGRLRLGIALVRYGYAGASGTVPSLTQVPPVTRANRVVYAHGALNEWWANGPAGLEEGFTVSSPPGVGTGPLTFSLALSGNLRPGSEAVGCTSPAPGGLCAMTTWLPPTPGAGPARRASP